MHARWLAAFAIAALPSGTMACDALVGLVGPGTGDDDAGSDGAGRDDSASDGGGDAACPGDAPNGIDPFFDSLAGAMCARMVGCAAIDDDLAACKASVAWALRSRRAALEVAEEAGTVAVDPCASLECVNDIQNRPCDPASSAQVAGQPPGIGPYEWFSPQTVASTRANFFSLMTAFSGGACAKAIAGSVPFEGGCSDPLECAPLTACLQLAPTGGICGQTVMVGRPCESTSACPTACTEVLPGSAPDAAPALLAPSSPLFALCGVNPAHQCVCSSSVLGEGQPCGGGVDTYGTELPCADGLVCDPTNTCRRPGSLSVDAHCTPGFDVECAPGLYCDPATSLCAARLEKGSPCQAEFACQDGMWCVGLIDAGKGVCQTPVSGSTCDGGPNNVALGSDGCLPLSEFCSGGRCVPLPYVGPCPYLLPIGGGGCSLILPSICTQPTLLDSGAPMCTPQGGAGMPCGSDFDCVSGSCGESSHVCAVDAGASLDSGANGNDGPGSPTSGDGGTTGDAWVAPLPVPMIYTGIAISGTDLYALTSVPGNVSVGRMSFAHGLPPIPSGGWTVEADSGDSITALAASPEAAYLGISGPSSAILGINTGLAAVTPFSVVDIASAFAGMELGPIRSLAADGTSVVWTQAIGSTWALLKHDLSDGNTAVTVLWGRPAADSPTEVALDDSYVYTVTQGGTLYAVSRDADGGAPIPLTSAPGPSPAPGIPPVAANGLVYFVSGAGPTSTGQVFAAAVGSPVTLDSNPSFPPPFVSAFAINGAILYFARGAQLWREAAGPVLLATASDLSDPLDAANADIVAVAVSGGYVAFLCPAEIGLVAEDQP